MPQNDRDSKGRFKVGNTICYSGWIGLVNRRFSGDFATAKEYVAQLGRYSYGEMCNSSVSTSAMVWRKQHIFFHPGTPETFTEAYRDRLNFDLSSVDELAY